MLEFQQGLDTLLVLVISDVRLALFQDFTLTLDLKTMPFRSNFSRLVVVYTKVGIDDLIRCYAINLTRYLDSCGLKLRSFLR